ncbi:MAG: glutamate--tRNA ligase, partial [Aquificota bacterium]
SKEGREIFSKEELIEVFSLEDINSSPAVFDKNKLRWLNGVYIRELVSLDRLTDEFVKFLEKEGIKAQRDYVKKVLEKTRDAFETLKEGVEKLRFFFVEELSYSEEAKAVLEKETSKNALFAFLSKLPEEPLTSQKVKEMAKEVQKELSIKAKDFWHALRASLTGELEGVSIDLVCELLPREVLIKRIKEAIEKF